MNRPRVRVRSRANEMQHTEVTDENKIVKTLTL
jgi:hypothetical protein